MPLDILLEYWIDHASFGFVYIIFRFSIRKFYRRVPGLAADSLCGVWCRELATIPLYVGTLFSPAPQHCCDGAYSLTQLYACPSPFVKPGE